VLQAYLPMAVLQRYLPPNVLVLLLPEQHASPAPAPAAAASKPAAGAAARGKVHRQPARAIVGWQQLLPASVIKAYVPEAVLVKYTPDGAVLASDDGATSANSTSSAPSMTPPPAAVPAGDDSLSSSSPAATSSVSQAPQGAAEPSTAGGGSDTKPAPTKEPVAAMPAGMVESKPPSARKQGKAADGAPSQHHGLQGASSKYGKRQRKHQHQQLEQGALDRLFGGGGYGSSAALQQQQQQQYAYQQQQAQPTDPAYYTPAPYTPAGAQPAAPPVAAVPLPGRPPVAAVPLPGQPPVAAVPLPGQDAAMSRARAPAGTLLSPAMQDALDLHNFSRARHQVCAGAGVGRRVGQSRVCRHQGHAHVLAHGADATMPHLHTPPHTHAHTHARTHTHTHTPQAPPMSWDPQLQASAAAVARTCPTAPSNTPGVGEIMGW
jgi:hypothetical protein